CDRSAPAPATVTEHVPRHGGTLTQLDDHQHHLEVTFDRTTGVLTLYLLDSKAVGTLKPEQNPLPVRMLIEGLPGDPGFDYPIDMTGNSENAYVAQSDLFQGAVYFKLVIPSLVIDGQIHENLVIDFPRGNEY